MRKLLVLIISIFTLYGCHTPQPIARLKVADGDKVAWRQGSEVVTMHLNGLYVEASFIESTPQYLVFYLNIINKSDLKYLVDPAQFLYNVDKFVESNSLRSSDIRRTRYFAINPENKILEMESNISRAESERKNALTRQIVSEIIVTTADIVEASRSDENNEYRAVERDIRRGERLEAYRNELDGYNENMYSSGNARNFWINEALRKTTLFPNYEAGGLVFFDRNDEAAILSFNFKVEDIDNIIIYNQVIHNP